MRSQQQLSFGALGDIFNDATTRLVGGVTPQNQRIILQDIAKVQSGLEQLLQSAPQDFQGTAAIHAQNIIDQLNLEKQALASVGTDPFAAKYINDVQRDLIDIVQGDDTLAALATQNGHHGFAAVPDLLVPATPFVGTAEQTAFMQNFITQTQSFADRAVAIANGGFNPADVQQLAADVQAYDTQADAFTRAQGGVYSARFNNEFADNGVNGTASRALIDGLMTGDAAKVQAAADVLIANSMDVAGNMLPNGSTPVDNGTGIPDQITTLAQAGTVFNDATAKLIGGVYAGNQQSIHNDLTATRQGVADLVANGTFTGRAATDATKIVGLLDKELQIVDSADPAAGAAKLNALHQQVISTVQHDAVLAAAASQDGATGFMALPDTMQGGRHGNGMIAHGGGGGWGGNAGCGNPAMAQQATAAAPVAATPAQPAVGPAAATAAAVPAQQVADAAATPVVDPAAQQPDPMAHIFGHFGGHHHFG